MAGAVQFGSSLAGWQRLLPAKFFCTCKTDVSPPNGIPVQTDMS
jgi:hypothetical protein